MRIAKQLSVRLANKPGRLAAMLGALNKSKVTFHALVVMDSGDRGTIRFVPDDFHAATEVLDAVSIRYDDTDVLLVEVPHQQGAFRKVCERLAEYHLNIDYAYSSFGGEQSTKAGVVAVIKVNDLAKAQKVLSENGSTGRRKRSGVPARRPAVRAR
jgi:hypothetical protein